MSKQENAKELQGYDPKPFVMMCGNCGHYSSVAVALQPIYGTIDFYEEKQKRCTLGGFAVKKTAVCKRWTPQVPG